VKTVGVRDFRDHATSYLAGAEPIAVSNRGVVIGFYIPLQRDHEQTERALKQLGTKVQQILAEAGMSEDELADLFRLRAPIE